MRLIKSALPALQHATTIISPKTHRGCTLEPITLHDIGLCDISERKKSSSLPPCVENTMMCFTILHAG